MQFRSNGGLIKLIVSASVAVTFIVWGQVQQSSAATTTEMGAAGDDTLSTPSPFDLERMAYFGES